MTFYPGKLSAIAVLSTISMMTFADYVDTDLIHTSNMSDVGFSLYGDGATLSGSTYQFPSSGHYCSVKILKGDFKAGEVVTIRLNEEEAQDNGLALRLLTWGIGQYKGYGGRIGQAELIGALPFDVSTISVGFCRYHNSEFGSFDLSEFSVQHTKEVVKAESIEGEHTEQIPVYPSCREYAREEDGQVVIVDDSEPRSLQELFTDGTIQPGATVYLRRYEATLSLHSGHKNFLDENSPWVTIIGENNATIESIKLSGVKNIRFTGLNITQEKSGYLVSTYGTENIIFDHNHISGGDDFDSWDAQKWQQIASGMMFRRGKCSTAYRNELENLRMGIQAYVRDNDMNPEVQSLKALVKHNLIKNISGDFMRPVGSDITIDGNIGLDHYVSISDGDSNHDDFIQGFAYPLGTEFNNVRITNNFYQSSTDISRPYQSEGQGVVIFDGLYTNFMIENNTVISDHWHGITVYWGKDGVIKNNTVMALDDTTGRYMWIQSEKDKSGKYNPENVVVTNNVANRFRLNANTVGRDNVTVNRVEVADHLVEFSPYELTFDAALKEDSLYYRESAGSSLTSVEKSLDEILK
ncbi:hypothetical protein [Thalassolituus sp.]|uniref:hypothetical protein n=1 Tax=Thalassolituus sp. TaxID=2030822 RepID=UPI0035129557